MAQRLICDACGEEIDQSIPYYTITAQKVFVEGIDDPDTINVLTTVQIARTFEFHDGHQPPVEPTAQPSDDDNKDDKDKS
jgi:hypothetical protein